MKRAYPEPGYTEGDLEELLFSGSFVFASCYTLTPKNGEPIRVTTASKQMTVHTLSESPETVTFLPGPVLMGQVRMKASIGLDVDAQTLKLDFPQDYEIWGMAFANALKWGLLDGGVLETDRYYSKNWGEPWVAGLKVFRGRVSSIEEVARSSAKMKVKSSLILLDTKVPGSYYQSSCGHAFGDAGCGIDRASLATEGTVGVGSTPGVLLWAGSTEGMATGTLLINNSDGVTFVRTVLKAVVGSRLELAFPLPFVPAPGTGFQVLPGCKRTYENCGVYNNQGRFKGFPFVPVAETAY